MAECLKCHGHVSEIRWLKKRLKKLNEENYLMRSRTEEDNSWFYNEEDAFAIETLNDDVAVIISARDLKKLL